MNVELEKQTKWLMSEDSKDFMTTYFEHEKKLRLELDGCDTPFCLDTPSCVCGASNEIK